MVVEVRKAGFANKGAELMLRAVIQYLRDNLPEAELAVIPRPTTPYRKRAQLGLLQKVSSVRYGVPWWRLLQLVPKHVRERYGLTLDSEIDVIIDAAGFAYGDQWGEQKTVETANAVKRWAKRRTKIVFMPQAFGPFSTKRIQQAFREVVEHADLIYARDKASYWHVTNLVGECNNVRIAPDFTNLVQGEVPESFDKQSNRFCIIPNYRMLDQTDSRTSQQYVSFLATCARELLDRAVKPFILIHETRNDQHIAREINEMLGNTLDIVTELDALRIKGIIGVCEGVISSRYHGLVSALSQGVPALGTGWTHKYRELFDDYDFPRGIIEVTADSATIGASIDLLIDPRSRSRIINTLCQAADRQKQAVESMWTQVLSVISS